MGKATELLPWCMSSSISLSSGAVISVSLSSMVKQPILWSVPPVAKNSTVRVHMNVATRRNTQLPAQSMFAPCRRAPPPGFPVDPQQQPKTCEYFNFRMTFYKSRFNSSSL